MSITERYATEIVERVNSGASLSDIVQLLKDFEEQNWIPVSSGELPVHEEFEPCIVLTMSEHGVTAGNFTQSDYGNGADTSWSAFLRPSTYEPEDSGVKSVTHWRPLPRFSECSLEMPVDGQKRPNAPTMMAFGDAPVGARLGGEIPSFLESHTQGLEDKVEDLLSYVEIHAQGLDMVGQIKAFPFDMPSFQFGAEWARDEVLRRFASSLNKSWALPEYNEILYHARVMSDTEFREYWGQIQNEIKPQP